jgi:pimeloyl-ACP methyl ester carboxylesterase
MNEWKFTTVDGYRTRYKDEGSGDPIVLFHGGEFGAGGADTWRDEMIDVLVTAGHRVVVVDRLGQGLTDNPRSDAEYRMSAVVDHATRFVRAMGIEGATLGGQSRGAFVASRIAMDHPELCRRLVIINSASISVRYPAEGVPGTLTYETYNKTMTGDVAVDLRIMSSTTEHLTDEFVARRTEIAALPKSQEARATFKRVHDEMFAEFEVLKAEVLKWFIGGGHRKPTLIIWGVGDPTTRASDGLDLFEVMQPHVDDLRLHMINRSGHWPHREYPIEVADEIRDFIARH